MQKKLAGLAMYIIATAAAAIEPGAPGGPAGGQTITRAGTQTATTGSPERFTGHVRVDPLFAADDSVQATAAYVSFAPGARSAWHTHPAGQRLVVTSGAGLTQEWGKPVQQIRTGDVIVCPPGVKHWHGAAAKTAMTHLAVSGVSDGKTVHWMEQVSDDQYSSR